MTAPTSGITNSPFIGVDNFHIAKMLTDPADGQATYDSVIAFPWLQSVSIEPQNEEATLYADNQAVDTANVTSKFNLTIDTATLPLEYKALLLGHEIENGVMTVASGDNPPYFAIMFETTKRNGKKRYVKFLKVQFSEPSETAQTKEEGVKFNTPSMTAIAIYRNDKKALYQADEEADGYLSATGENWYTSVDPSGE